MAGRSGYLLLTLVFLRVQSFIIFFPPTVFCEFLWYSPFHLVSFGLLHEQMSFVKRVETQL